MNSLDLMPQPFAWIEIPNKAYSISKYPVTNAQYTLFVEAGGYKTPAWWTQQGWELCQKEKWTAARYYGDNFTLPDQPVIGVSWFEAVAFCLWLSEVSDEKIMLPTEEQWQYAAQGDDGRHYPWGNTWWDETYCNNSVGKQKSTQTSPVRQYEDKNISPFGVVDMSGNVSEWALTNYETGVNDVNEIATFRTYRGAAWNSESVMGFRVDARYQEYPKYGHFTKGFRLART